MVSQKVLVFFILVRFAVAQVISMDLLQPAPISCNAAFSAPCARTNSQYLALSTKEAFYDSNNSLEEFFELIQNHRFNLDTGFYPFVVSVADASCAAHGANPSWAGRTLADIFDEAGIRFADTEALHQRFVDAAGRGGDWVQYLWSDYYTDPTNLDENTIIINSKRAFVTNLTADFYLGVGYENQQLPPDVPCSAKYDSWCSITNVRSLVGAVQFRLEQADSLENFEAAVYDISFAHEIYTIDEGFYPFLYHYSGKLKGHSILHEYFGFSLGSIFEAQGLGPEQEGLLLNDLFVKTAESQRLGTGTGWVQYEWRNSLQEESYTKVAYVTQVVFEGEEYYLGVGFDFVKKPAQSSGLGVDEIRCTADYNLPCAFEKTLRLSSHALTHVISSSLSPGDRWKALSSDDSFRDGDFYVFAYDFNNTCVSHGLVPNYVGKSLTEVFDLNNLQLDAEKLHDQFRTAASRGGGWVAYDWLVPGVANSEFEKISYLFKFTVDGRDFYGGVGFNHKRAPVEAYSDIGTKKSGEPIPCSVGFGLTCSEVNTRAVLGQALGDLTLATSPVAEISNERNLSTVLANINARSSSYSVNDFTVSVFTEESRACAVDDGSGCCIADGNEGRFVGFSWKQILDKQSITSIQGYDLHNKLVAQANNGVSWIEYPWSGGMGEAQTKRSWTASFREAGKEYYVVAEYFTTSLPPTCDACPNNMECTAIDQSFCEEKPPKSLQEEEAFIAMIATIPLLIACFFVLRWRQKKNHEYKLRLVENELGMMAKKLEQNMKGMVKVVHSVPVESPEKYRELIRDSKIAETNAYVNAASNWYWEEDASVIDRHDPGARLKSTNYICYPKEISQQLEHAFQRYTEGKGFCDVPMDLSDKITKVHNAETGFRYVMNFERLEQRNVNTGHPRQMHRVDIERGVDSMVAHILPSLPDDVDFTSEDKAENLLPLYEGLVIQVSKSNETDEWLFGNVLYDPMLLDAQKNTNAATSSDGLNSMLCHALHERPTSGWLPKAATEHANASDMRHLLDTLGGAGAEDLRPPITWDESHDGLVLLPEATNEYQAVTNYFLKALYNHSDGVEIVRIERIQNIPLWQSYAVKKQTMKTRVKEHPEHLVNNSDPNIERQWLFHGTTKDIAPKIVRQGFNRAFAGRNAVVYGKGVYFARDASYSSHEAYSEPDDGGVQRMFLCRVAVGDWCKGKTGQLTPDTKNHNSLELFDSTVDNVQNPSIFVVYHDAQAYPEYLVSFKRQMVSL